MKKYFIYLVLLILTGALCANEIHDINNQELKELMQKNVAVIDVRASSEWHETGIIENSHLVMFYDEKGRFDLNTWLADIAKIADINEPLVLICHSGSRSKQLARYLTKVVGYENVYNVRRGIAYWIKKNNEVIKYP